MNTTRTLLAWALVATLPALAQIRPAPSVPAPAVRGFEENKGQVTTLDGKPAPFVRYRLTDGGTNIFLLGDGIAYQFTRVDYPEGYREALAEAMRDPRLAVPAELRAQVRIEAYRMDLELDGADPHALMTATGRSADRTNYCNHGVLDVRTFTEVTYHDVYPGIDRVIRVSERGVEQDFVVHPGADPSLIRMRFVHHEELGVDKAGGLLFGNRFGRFQEQRPVGLQGDREVATRFVMEGNILSFALDTYDPKQTLVIDPPLQWATYYGGPVDDQSQGCATDADGNVYLTGWTNSTNGIASGGYQMSLSGGDDGMIVKLNANGERQWATYYGGGANDAFRGAAVDADGNVYASGLTESDANIAFNMPGSQYSGAMDAMLVKLNTDGDPQWGMYYGGEDEDRGRWCSVDGSGNVYMTGLTRSLQNIATTGCYQPVPGGFQEAFLVKFNTDGQRLWGTYYGGASDEQAMGCATDAAGTTYIAGGTGTSTGTAIASPGSHQPDFGGPGSDAFLAKFNSDGIRVWGTYYGGASNDYGFACGLDAQGNVFTTGDTQSDNGNSIASPGGHQTTFGGGVDAFLVKFNSDGQRQWGTYYGGVAGDFGRGCFADSHGTIYLVGETESSTNISTPGAYQENFGGAPVDDFLARFYSDGIRAFGTYYGGEAQDYASTGMVDANGNTYLLGVTGSQTAISTPDAHQDTYGGGALDAFLAKFDAPLDCLGEPNGPALPTTPCDDGDVCTGSDVWSLLCACTGTFQDGDADGLCDAEDPCPTLPFLVSGDPCDDGNEFTINDVVFPNCQCFGEFPVDCEGNAGGPAQPGVPCADNDPCTVQEVWSLACTCTGMFQDSDGDGDCDALDSCPDVPGQMGDACDDADPCTLNDVLDDNCACTGTFQDSDGDGLCDGIDPCPMGANTIPGATCDDGDICTTGDVITTDCVCLGSYQDTDGDGVCDPQDSCPDVAGQVGDPCVDTDVCTTDEVLNADCICTGTVITIGSITGEEWVVGDSTYTFSIGPVPGATAYSWDPLPVNWITTDASQAQLVVTTANTAGLDTLCVTVYISACSLDTCIIVQVSPVGIEETANGASPWYTVSPNPSSGNFLLTRTEGVTGAIAFTVLDATGRTIAAPRIPTGPRTMALDLGDAAAGVYFLRMERDGGTQVLPLVVRR